MLLTQAISCETEDGSWTIRPFGFKRHVVEHISFLGLSYFISHNALSVLITQKSHTVHICYQTTTLTTPLCLLSILLYNFTLFWHQQTITLHFICIDELFPSRLNVLTVYEVIFVKGINPTASYFCNLHTFHLHFSTSSFYSNLLLSYICLQCYSYFSQASIRST